MQQRARNHIAALENAGHRFFVADLTWTEAFVWPFRSGDGFLLMDYHRFLLGPNVTTLPAGLALYRRAAMIRAKHRFGIADSLHLAAAVENRLDRFLTNDNRLAAFPDISVEILP